MMKEIKGLMRTSRHVVREVAREPTLGRIGEALVFFMSVVTFVLLGFAIVFFVARLAYVIVSRVL